MTIMQKAHKGFTLIEVVAAAALLGLLVTMAMPSLNAANAKVKNSRLKADLATVDQAIQLYVIDKGTVPTALTDLSPDYIAKISEVKDAKNANLSYAASGNGYTLSGQNTAGETVLSNGSDGANTDTSVTNTETRES